MIVYSIKYLCFYYYYSFSHYAGLLRCCSGASSTEYPSQAREVYNRLDEYGIVSQIGALARQLSQRTEQRAAAGDVHLTDWPLEGGGGDVGAEGVDDVLPVVLIQEHQRHLRTEQEPGLRAVRRGCLL